jgi:hypothetical protein
MHVLDPVTVGRIQQPMNELELFAEVHVFATCIVTEMTANHNLYIDWRSQATTG